MAKKRLPVQELDLTSQINKIVMAHECKIINMALRKLFPCEDFNVENVNAQKERVRNYSMGIFTYRYKGVLLLRRFPLSMDGLQWKYESPIYDTDNN